MRGVVGGTAVRKAPRSTDQGVECPFARRSTAGAPSAATSPPGSAKESGSGTAAATTRRRHGGSGGGVVASILASMDVSSLCFAASITAAIKRQDRSEVGTPLVMTQQGDEDLLEAGFFPFRARLGVHSSLGLHPRPADSRSSSLFDKGRHVRETDC